MHVVCARHGEAFVLMGFGRCWSWLLSFICICVFLTTIIAWRDSMHLWPFFILENEKAWCGVYSGIRFRHRY